MTKQSNKMAYLYYYFQAMSKN